MLDNEQSCGKVSAWYVQEVCPVTDHAPSIDGVPLAHSSQSHS